MSALDPSKLVFIDESGFDTRMTRRFGRAARGAPCVGAVPHGHWRNNTFIAGLRSDRIDAPMLIEGAMDGDAFSAWVERMLAPTLSAGDIVICDNLSVHKNAQARAAIEARGAELRARTRLFARPQPDRDGICQDQGTRAQRCCEVRREPLYRHRIRPYRLHPPGMCALSPARRVCFNLIENDSKRDGGRAC